MQRIIRFFQTLRGKLIVTYTLVTVLALLALEVTVLVFGMVFSNGIKSDRLAYLSDVVSMLPVQARPYLQPGAVDQPGLQRWLQGTYDSGYASPPAQGLMDSPAAAIGKSDPMVVLAPDGTVLAAAPASEKSLVGRRYTPPSSVARSQDILNNALNLQYNPSQVTALKPDGSYLVAVPVAKSIGDKTLVGVIIVTVNAPPSLAAGTWALIAGIVILTGMVLLIGVAPFAALFGFVMSNGLTRRLRALALAADAWSEGNFNLQPPQDRSQDEISYLGKRMRRMAEHIQTLMLTEHELALMEERNRLARELHDTVKQETFATLMQVRAAKNLLERDPAAARECLDEAEELIRSSQQELGLMIAELRPAALDGRGLADALRSFLESWSQHSHIPHEIQVLGEQRLPLEVEQALYRVAQEALSNAARHSRASAVSVRLEFTPDQVSLCIGDNGVGFNPAAAAGHGFGLQSMRDRMAAVGGRLRVQAASDNGTAITATAPLDRFVEKGVNHG
jgi:NarL family two-component system sensor histidine kinase LiaS